MQYQGLFDQLMSFISCRQIGKPKKYVDFLDFTSNTQS